MTIPSGAPLTGHLSPIILTQLGREFLEAARREAALKNQISLPAYFLVARSIELGIKAFLVLKGHSEAQLKAIGHDLESALEEARRHGFDSLVSPSQDHKAALEILNLYYKSKDLEYTQTGYKSYPRHDLLVAFADGVLASLAAPLRNWNPPA